MLGGGGRPGQSICKDTLQAVLTAGLSSCAACWVVLGPVTEPGHCKRGTFPFSSLQNQTGGTRLCGASLCAPVLTGCAEEGSVELPGNQGIRHVPKKLFEQSSHVMNALMLIQENIQALVKLFPQLKDGRKEKNKSNSQFFLFV